MRFVIVDGLDGVGKDTQALLIKKRYEEKGEHVVIRSHPESDNFFGRSAKKALLGCGKINRLKASVFYALDVLRSLRLYYYTSTCDTLIIVRYLMGTAYLPKRLASLAYHVFEKFVPTSEYMFFLDATPEHLVDRVKQRGETEMFENYTEFLKVRAKALSLAKGWHIVSTDRPVNETFSEISSILDDLDRKK